MNIIIFLAPMSGFNQVLAEDESVNRLVRKMIYLPISVDLYYTTDGFVATMANDL